MAVLPWGRVLAGLVAAMIAAPVAATNLTITVTGAQGEPLRYAVAYVGSPRLAERAAAGARPEAVVDQRGQQFRPHTQAIQRRSTVRFPNSDQVRHHVYSFSEARTFELRLYADEPPRPIRFDREGVVILGCNIHDHMTGYLLVVDTPVFAAADRDGVIRLRGVPDDPQAVLRVWHPELGDQDSARRVSLDGDTRIAVSLPVQDREPPEPAGLGDRRRNLQDRFGGSE